MSPKKIKDNFQRMSALSIAPGQITASSGGNGGGDGGGGCNAGFGARLAFAGLALLSLLKLYRRGR